MPEIGRHHSDDGVSVFVHQDAPADDVRIGAELTAPESVADDRGFGETGDRIRGFDHASQRRAGPEQAEIFEGGSQHLDPLGAIAAPQRRTYRKNRAEALK